MAANNILVGYLGQLFPTLILTVAASKTRLTTKLFNSLRDVLHGSCSK